MTSPCSTSYVGVLFNNGTLPSVCGEYPIVLATIWVVWGISMGYFCSITQLDVSHPGTSFVDKRNLFGALYFPMFRDFFNFTFIYISILGSLYCILRFF